MSNNHPQESTTSSRATNKFKFLTVAEIKKLPNPRWLIKNILVEGGMFNLFGAPGVGKTFLALDWAA